MSAAIPLLADRHLLQLFMGWQPLFCFPFPVVSDTACLLALLLAQGVRLVSPWGAKKRRYPTALWPVLDYLPLPNRPFLPKVVSYQSMSHQLSQCIWQPAIYLYCWIGSCANVPSFGFKLHHDTFSLLPLLGLLNQALALPVFAMLLRDFLPLCIQFANVLGPSSTTV